MTASLATYPHEVVRTRLQTQRRPLADDASSDGMIKTHPRGGVINVTKKIVRREGWTGLYKGLSVNLLRTVPNSAVTMLTWVDSTRFRRCCWLTRCSFIQVRAADETALRTDSMIYYCRSVGYPRRRLDPSQVYGIYLLLSFHFLASILCYTYLYNAK
jgi:hypothetical protein